MKIANLINKNKHHIVNIIVIIVALIIANKIYRNQTKNIESLKVKKEAELKYNDMLKNIIQQEKKMAAYKKLLSKENASSVINNISNLAKQCEIKIISLKPESEKDYFIYVKYPFSLVISINNYHALGKFISKIESSADIYVIEAVNIRPLSENLEESGTARLSADLKLSAIIWKD